MRSFLKITSPEHQPESSSRIGKLVVFAGLEPGVGKALCTASIATRLARRWRCLAIELDNRSNLQTFLSLRPGERKVPASFEDLATSLEHFKTKTTVPNLDFIGWPGGFPGIDRFLNSLRSDPADYVFAALAAGTSDESAELFAAADVSVIVTHPEHSREKIFEFLQRFATLSSLNGNVYILLNQIRRGGEEKEAAAFVEGAGASLGLKLSILGTAVYDPQTAAGFVHGASLAAFEDIALKIERLLPRMPSAPTVSQPAHNRKRNGRGSIVALVMAPFGRKRQEFEEKLQRRDQLIASLQQRHESMIDDLQEMLQQKSSDIAEKGALIDGLEDEIRRYTQQLLEGNKRAAELDAAVAAQQAELDRSLKHIRQNEDTNALLAREKAALIHENQVADAQLAERASALSALERTVADLQAVINTQRGELHDLQEQILRLEGSNDLLLHEKATLQLQKENIETERDQTARRFQEDLNEKAKHLEELEDQIRHVEGSNRGLSAAKAESETALRESTEQLAQKTQYIDDLGGRLVAQQNNLHQLENRIRQVEESNRGLSAAKAEGDTALRGLTRQLAQKTTYIQELEGRLAAQQDSMGEFQSQIHRLEDASAVLAAEKEDRQQAVSSLTQQLNEKAKCIEDLDQRIAAQQGDLQNLRDQIRQFGEWNGLLEEEKTRLQNQAENLEFARDEIGRRLTEAEAVIGERNILIESKDVVIRKLAERLAELSSGHEALASRTSEALQQLFAELRLHREQSQATIEKWHGLVSSMEAQTAAVAGRATDVVMQKDAVIRQVEEAYQRELLELLKLQGEKDTAIQRLEKVLRIVEEDNDQLKFDLMAVLERTVTRPGPDVLLRERGTLIRLLRSDAGPSATVIAIHEAGKETFEFAIEMRSILDSAGWNVDFMTSSFEKGRFYGVQIVKDGSEIGDLAARLLSNAFENVGIPFVSRTAPTPKSLSPLRLIIGQTTSSEPES